MTSIVVWHIVGTLWLQAGDFTRLLQYPFNAGWFFDFFSLHLCESTSHKIENRATMICGGSLCVHACWYQQPALIVCWL